MEERFPCPVYTKEGLQVMKSGIEFTPVVREQLENWGITELTAEQPPLPKPLEGSSRGKRERFKIGKLSSGDVFDCSLYAPNGQKLAEPFTRLDEHKISRLQDWDIFYVYAENPPLSGEQKDEYRKQAAQVTTARSFANLEEKALEGIENQSAVRSCVRFDSADKKFVRETYREALSATEEILEKFSRGIINSVSRLYSPIKSIKSCLLNYRMLLLYLISEEAPREDEDYIYKYSLHTALISIMIGDNLDLPLDECLRLGVGGLIHDVGMLKIPRTIRKKEGELSSEQRKKMKHHLARGQEMLSNLDFYNSSLRHVLEEHHEKYDGSGYPRQLSGDDIHLHARIINLVMTYVALRQPRYYRQDYGVSHSVRAVIYEHREQFDPEVLDAFLNVMGVFPPGSFVQLNEGQHGLVIKPVKDQPLDPIVRVIAESSGVPLEEPYRLLLAKSELSIEKIIDGDQHGYDAFELV